MTRPNLPALLALALAALVAAASGCTSFTAPADVGDRVVLQATIAGVTLPGQAVTVGEPTGFGSRADDALVGLQSGDRIDAPVQVHVRNATFGPTPFRVIVEERSVVEEILAHPARVGEVVTAPNGAQFRVLAVGPTNVTLENPVLEDGHTDHEPSFGVDVTYDVGEDAYWLRVKARPGETFTQATAGGPFGLPSGRYVALDNEDGMVRFARLDSGTPACTPGAPRLITPTGGLFVAPGETKALEVVACNLGLDVNWTSEAQPLAGLSLAGPRITMQGQPTPGFVSRNVRVSASGVQDAEATVPVFNLREGESSRDAVAHVRVLRVEKAEVESEGYADTRTSAREGGDHPTPVAYPTYPAFPATPPEGADVDEHGH